MTAPKKFLQIVGAKPRENRYMRTRLATTLTVLLVATSPASACAAPVEAAPATATVLRVVDGDTVDVVDDVRGRLRVRVLGLDTPETKRRGYAVACWGPEATAFATATLQNQRVALIADAGQDARDRYGRTLAYIQTAGGDYSVLAAAAGAGRAYVFDPSHPPQRADEIAAAEASARKAGLGLWGPPCFGQTEAVPL